MRREKRRLNKERKNKLKKIINCGRMSRIRERKKFPEEINYKTPEGLGSEKK